MGPNCRIAWGPCQPWLFAARTRGADLPPFVNINVEPKVSKGSMVPKKFNWLCNLQDVPGSVTAMTLYIKHCLLLLGHLLLEWSIVLTSLIDQPCVLMINVIPLCHCLFAWCPLHAHGVRYYVAAGRPLVWVKSLMIVKCAAITSIANEREYGTIVVRLN
jgi:hypothetical protein